MRINIKRIKYHKNWIVIPLDSICDKITDGTHFTPKYISKGVPFISVKDIYNGKIYFNDCKYISETDHNKLTKRCKPEKDDILITKSGTIGRMALVPSKPEFSLFVSVALIKNKKKFILSKFLKYCLENYLNTISIAQDIKGGLLKNFHLEDIRITEVPVVPLPEQRAIVSKIEQLFSELDSGVENLKKAQAQLKVYRQAVLKWAFAGKLTEDWRKQQKNLPTAETLLAQIKTEREKQAEKSNKKLKPIPPISKEELPNLPVLPQSWIWVRLDNLGSLGRGKSKHRPRNDKKLFGGKYPFIQTGEVKAAGYLIQSFENTYSEFGLSQSKLWTIGTLCITIAANIAETAFLGINACFPDSIVGFIGDERIISSKFIFYFFKGNQNKLEAFAPATAQKNINLKTLETLIIPYCSLIEQNQIVLEIEERLSVCDKLEETIDQSLQKTESLRQSILKKAFEGKLLTNTELEDVRKAPDWEPAEKLLQRIKQEKNLKKQEK